jgi:AcrR family transcriptional regulator
VAEPVHGLRERKKERTRAVIKAEAMKLFRQQGFAQTTVEQIAAATWFSTSTFFRYFPTKESVVLDDQNQQEIVAAFDAQPADLDLVTAMHRAVIEVFSRLERAELAELRKRNRLILATRELRAAYMEHLFHLMTLISKSAARRTGLEVTDLEIRTFAWTMQGALTAASTYWTETVGTSLVECFDYVFSAIENGEFSRPA